MRRKFSVTFALMGAVFLVLMMTGMTFASAPYNLSTAAANDLTYTGTTINSEDQSTVTASTALATLGHDTANAGTAILYAQKLLAVQMNNAIGTAQATDISYAIGRHYSVWATNAAGYINNNTAYAQKTEKNDILILILANSGVSATGPAANILAAAEALTSTGATKNLIDTKGILTGADKAENSAGRIEIATQITLLTLRQGHTADTANVALVLRL